MPTSLCPTSLCRPAPHSSLQINLSPDKPRVLREVFRVLAPGGEMYFSDVYCDRRLPAEVRNQQGLLQSYGDGVWGCTA